MIKPVILRIFRGSRAGGLGDPCAGSRFGLATNDLGGEASGGEETRLMPHGMWISLLVLLSAVRLHAAVRYDFDGSDVSWRPAGGDVGYRLLAHARVGGSQAHDGQRCEHLRFTASNGSALYFSHFVQPARVIDELRLTVWVRSDRAPVRLLARIVLPRSKHPETGQPHTVLVSGPRLDPSLGWQPLELGGVPEQLEREVWTLRGRFRSSVDSREAYIDQVVLDLYGGPGPTSVWIDTLELTGFVPQSTDDSGVSDAAPVDVAGDEPGDSVLHPRRDGSIFLVEDWPILPRMIRYRGEPLKLLKGLGFNLVQCASFPSADVLAEARQAQVGLVCPCPLGSEAAPGRAAMNPVVAWHLGDPLAGPQLDEIQNAARRIQREDPRPDRPMIGRAVAKHRAYSRLLDILLTGRDPIGSSQTLAEYARWLNHRPLLVRLGTPLWVHVQTQLPEAILKQRAALGFSGTSSHSVDPAQIEQLAWIALSTGGRGLAFDSRTSLGGRDLETRYRALALQMLNLKLKLVEPWLASASPEAHIQAVGPVDHGTANVTAAVLSSRANRARILLPIRWEPALGNAAGSRGDGPVSFVVPAVPETYEAYLVTPVALPRLPRERVTGGVQVTLDSLHTTAIILLTQDPLVETDISRRIARQRNRAARLGRDLAAIKLERSESVEQRLGGLADKDELASSLLVRARAELARCDAMLQASNAVRAFEHAENTLALSSSFFSTYRNRAADRGNQAVSSPLGTAAAFLADEHRFRQRIAAAHFGPNRLQGGDFEALTSILHAGWKNEQYREEGVGSAVQLSPSQPHGGRFCLQLRAWPIEQPHEFLGSPPVWVTTQPVHVAAGDIVRMHGWVRVRTRVRGSVDGLMVVDSLGGETLAPRFTSTAGWQEFTLYRVAPAAGSVSLSLVLTGLGEAEVDDVSIATLQRTDPPAALDAQRLPRPVAATPR